MHAGFSAKRSLGRLRQVRCRSHRGRCCHGRADEMRAAADSAFQHNISTPLPGIKELLRILAEVTSRNVALIAGLRTLRNLGPIIDEIERLNEKALAAN